MIMNMNDAQVLNDMDHAAIERDDNREHDHVALLEQAFLDSQEFENEFEQELAKAPQRLRSSLRAECDGCATTVYAVLNNCITTKNPLLLLIVEELHGGVFTMNDAPF